MNIDKQVKEVLSRLVNLGKEYVEKEIVGENCAICGFPFDKKIRKKAVNNAHAQIHSLYLAEFKKILPEKMHTYVYRKTQIFNYNAGFNACLAEIKAKLRERRDV